MSKIASPKRKVQSNDTKLKNPYLWMFPLFIVLLTFFVYRNITAFDLQTREGYDFLNWDDPSFVLGNTSITAFSGENIHKMFTDYYMGNYVPLSIFSYAIDYKIGGGLNPKAFHTTNLLLHLASSVVLFFFIYYLSSRRMMVAGITSLLFALHPMHVESVAWISERRDVLYTFFFISSLLAYLLYVDRRQTSNYYWSLLLFLLSLLSKGQAVTLAACIVLLDFVRRDSLKDKKLILEKIPFFILSLVFGIIAFRAQHSTPAVNSAHLTFLQSFFIGFYTYSYYLFKAIIPIGLSGYHPYPFKPEEGLPGYFYAFPVLIGVFAWLVFRYFKNDRNILFGILFFSLTIFPVLQFLPVGETIISERYTYLPYIGLFWLIAYVAENAAKYKVTAGLSTVLLPVVIGFILILTVITSMRVPIFKNSIAFWSDVIEKYPQDRVARNNRGYMYNEFGQPDLALADFNVGIATDPAYARLYVNRGLSFEKMKRYDEALRDYAKSISLDSSEAQVFINVGVIYTDVKGRPDIGIKYNRKALQREPDNFKAQMNMGISYYKSNRQDSAVYYYTQAMKFPHIGPEIYYFRALAYAAQNDFRKALEDAATAKSKGHNVEEALVRQWQAQLK